MHISTRRKFLVGFTTLFLILALAVWGFFVFYFDSVFSTVASEKLSSAVNIATSGRYQLALRRISYSHGVVVARGVELTRIGYHVDERGVAVRNVSIDSVRLEGVDLWDVALGHPLSFSKLLVNDPKVYSFRIEEERSHLTLLPNGTTPAHASSTPSISIESAIVSNAQLFRTSVHGDMLSGVASASSRHVCLDGKAPSPFTFKQLTLAIPQLDLPDSGELTALHVRNLVANSEDSILTIDTISYAPTMREGAYTNARAVGLRSEGIDFALLMRGKGIAVRTLAARSWNLEQQSGKTSSKDTSTKHTFTQDDLAKLIPISISVGRLDLPNGDLSLIAEKGSPVLVRDIGLHIEDIHIAPNLPSSDPLFSKQITIAIPQLRYPTDGATADVTGFHINVRDSLVTVRTIRYPKDGTTYGIKALRAEGIDFNRLLNGKGIALAVLKSGSWSIEKRTDEGHAKRVAAKKTLTHSSSTQAVSIPIQVGRIELPHGTIKLETIAADSARTASVLSIKGVSVGAWQFNLDPTSLKHQPPLFSQQVKLKVPSVSIVDSDGFYAVQMRNMQVNLRDSLVTIDSVGYLPQFSDSEYTARHPHPLGSTAVQSIGLRAEGIDFAGIFAGHGIKVRRVSSPDWWVSYFMDWRRPADNNLLDVPLPHDMVRTIRYPITINQFALENGHVLFRERAVNSVKPGVLTFSNVKIISTPFTTDTTNGLYHAPMRFNLHALSIDEATLAATASYALTDTGFDLSLDGAVGPFSAKRLNTWLISNERLEALDGALDTGIIKIRIQSSVATTTVTPFYHDLSLEVLAPLYTDSTGIVQDVQTLFAKSFVIRSNNRETNGEAVKSATTTLTRSKDEYLFQFIWLSLRKSIGGVIGGFE